MPRVPKKEFIPKRNTFDKLRAEKGAPCVFFEWDEKKQETKAYHPAVSCDMNCASCGFNPKEQERRLKTGVFKTAAVLDTDTHINGRVDYRAALVKQLTFKKGDNWGWINTVN